MASRSEIASQISSLIGEGKVRDAYKQFEELPVLDQIAISVSPGVGDVLTAYEVAEFSTRAKENVQEGDTLGALGYGALAGLGLISFVPLLRFLRARKAGKLMPEEKEILPAPIRENVEEVEKISTKKTKKPGTAIDAGLKEPEEVITNINEKPFSDLVNDDLTVSKIRRTIRNEVGQNLPTNMKLSLLIKSLRGKGIDNTELRSSEVIDAYGELHPNLVAKFGTGQAKVNLDDFDDYIRARTNKYSIEKIQKQHETRLTKQRLGYILNENRQPTNFIQKPTQRLHVHQDMKNNNVLRGRSDLKHYSSKDKDIKNSLMQLGFDDVSKYIYDFDAAPRATGIELGVRGLGQIPTAPDWLKGGKKVYHLHRLQSDYADRLADRLSSGEKFFSKKEFAEADIPNFIKQYGQEINQAGLLQATVKQYKNRLKTEKLDAAERKNIKNDIKVMEQDIEKIANKLFEKNENFDLTFGLPKASDIRKPGQKENFSRYLREAFYNQSRVENAIVPRIITSTDLKKGRVDSTLKFIRGELGAPQFIRGNEPSDMIFTKVRTARPKTNRLTRSPFDEGGGNKGFSTEYMEPMLRRNLAEAIDEGYDVMRIDNGNQMAYEANQNKNAMKLYDEKIPQMLTRIFKDLGLDPKEYILKVPKPPRTDAFPTIDLFHEGNFVKIDDKLREIFARSGIPSYRNGGLVQTTDLRLSKGKGFDELDEIERKLDSLGIAYDYTKDGEIKTV